MCHICNFTESNEIAPENCSRCGASYVNPDEEKLLKQSVCQFAWAPKKIGDNCVLYLTDKRLLVVKNSAGIGYAGGVVGVLVASAVNNAMAKKQQQDWGDSISLDAVSSFQESKFGLLVKAFVITFDDGTELKVSAKPREDWISAIKNAKAQLVGVQT